MARPVPGTIFGAARLSLTQSHAPLWLAHSDLSGFSLFEEANYQGIAAAEEVLRHLGIGFESSL